MARRRRKNSTLPIIIFLTIMLVVMAGAFIYLLLFSNTMMIRGEWTRQVDMTGYVRNEIEDYLETANMGDEIELDQYMSDMTIECHMVLDADGNYSEQLDIDSYNACMASARNVLKQAVTALIQKRMEAVKIDSGKDISALVSDTAGMDMDSYLMKYGPQLLPAVEDLQSENNRVGSYTADRSSITIHDAEGNSIGNQSGNLYLVSNGTLVINYGDNTYIYLK